MIAIGFGFFILGVIGVNCSESAFFEGLWSFILLGSMGAMALGIIEWLWRVAP
jgi:hypothetical protein